MYHSLRGYAAGIYTTNTADACYHCLVSSRANIVAVQDKKQLDKILSVRDKLPLLKAIIQWEGVVDTSIQGVYSVSSFSILQPKPNRQVFYSLIQYYKDHIETTFKPVPRNLIYIRFSQVLVLFKSCRSQHVQKVFLTLTKYESKFNYFQDNLNFSRTKLM